MTDPDILKALFDAGVTAVRGDTAVTNDLRDHPVQAPDRIIAVGKAATAMAQAAHAHFPEAPVLVVTKYHHAADAPGSAEVIEAAHPVLDDSSLRAGARLREVVSGMAGDSHLLFLISGGASALAEDPVDGLDLAGLRARVEKMLASGADIHAMNAARKDASRIKGGKLLGSFRGARATTLAISDVEGDALDVIGSGLGAAPSAPSFDFVPRIVASNAIAREAVCAAALSHDVTVVTDEETLYADIEVVAPRIGTALCNGVPGLYLWGGEPTVILPETPGVGGRNQSLALLIAREIAGLPGLRVLVAGTDGTDGPTDAAGAIVDGQTWDATGAEALAAANAGPWLEARGALLRTGPTGTNVMDLVIALKS